MRTITLNPRQQREVEILSRLEAGALDAGTPGELLGVGVRQIRRCGLAFAGRAWRPSSMATLAVARPMAPIQPCWNGSWPWPVPTASTTTCRKVHCV